MRRTEQEFKEEVLRRSEAFRRQRSARRKKSAGALVCVCLCIGAVLTAMPSLASSRKEAATESVAMAAPKFDPSLSAGAGYAADYVLSDSVSAEEPHEEEIAAVSIVHGDSVIRLNDADSELIASYLHGEWIASAANCLCDYTLDVNGAVYHYHSDCGTIQDMSGSSLMLNAHDREVFNEILGCYVQ